MRLVRTAFVLLLWLYLPLAFSQTVPAKNQGVSSCRTHFSHQDRCVRSRNWSVRRGQHSLRIEDGSFRKPELVELVKLDPTIKLDIRYATSNNFLSTPMYSQARAFLQRPAAEALLRAQRALQGKRLRTRDP